MRERLVLAFAEDALPARAVAEAARLPFAIIEEHRFPDGEGLVRAPEAAQHAILYRALHRPDAKLMPLLQAADALHRAGAEQVTLVAPYMPYMRQDQVFEAGQPLSRDVLGKVLAGAFEHIVTVQAHLHRTPSLANVFPGVDVTNLPAAPAFKTLAWPDGLVVVAPDIEAAPWARALASLIGADNAFLTKTRLGDRSVLLGLSDPDCVRGRPVLVFDDIVSSGATAVEAARTLRAAGAASIELAVVHALFDAWTVQRLGAAGIARVVSTDAVPHWTNEVPLAGLLAEALNSGGAPCP